MITQSERRKELLTKRGQPQRAQERGFFIGELMRLRSRLAEAEKIPTAQDAPLSLEHRVRVLREGGVLLIPHRERKFRLRGSDYQVKWGAAWLSTNASEISWLFCPEELVVLDLDPPKDNEVKE